MLIILEEIWREIDGYDGKYKVSNLGRVKSYKTDTIDGKILKGTKDWKGYPKCTLRNSDGECKIWFIHRLVALAFIPNPFNLPQVNHKDENKENNNIDNLEWCTNKYNHSYGTRDKRAGESNHCCPTTSKKVYSVDVYGQIEYFDSIGDAERITGNSHCNIVRALKGRRPRCGNRQWFYY